MLIVRVEMEERKYAKGKRAPQKTHSGGSRAQTKRPHFFLTTCNFPQLAVANIQKSHLLGEFDKKADRGESAYHATFYQFRGKRKYKSALPSMEKEVARKINPASFYSP